MRWPTNKLLFFWFFSSPFSSSRVKRWKRNGKNSFAFYGAKFVNGDFSWNDGAEKRVTKLGCQENWRAVSEPVILP